jgi:hypothetical protein
LCHGPERWRVAGPNLEWGTPDHIGISNGSLKLEAPMADDLTDAEDILATQGGIENHPHGRLLARLVRTVRVLVTRVKALEDRVRALEGG